MIGLLLNSVRLWYLHISSDVVIQRILRTTLKRQSANPVAVISRCYHVRLSQPLHVNWSPHAFISLFAIRGQSINRSFPHRPATPSASRSSQLTKFVSVHLGRLGCTLGDIALSPRPWLLVLALLLCCPKHSTKPRD